METTATLRRKLDNANDKIFYWFCEYESELEWYEIRKRGVTLKDKFGADNVADKAEKSGIEIYEDDFDAPAGRKKVTRKAIARLRFLEKKIAEWEAKASLIEDALDAWSELNAE